MNVLSATSQLWSADEGIVMSSKLDYFHGVTSLQGEGARNIVLGVCPISDVAVKEC